jgi:YkoY family integral membrane protein
MTVDLATIGLLVVLEALLSADNALVMAVMVLGLPREQHARALSYGLFGAFVLRIAATLLATLLIRVVWVKAVGGLYLIYLVARHFLAREGGTAPTAPQGRTVAFWPTVIRLELMNLAFSVDSILVAVAMSPNKWVVLSGGLLGVLAMRVIASRLVVLMQRYPALADGAFVIILWVGLRLLIDYAHDAGWIGWRVSQGWSLLVILLLLAASLVYAFRQDTA